MNIRNMTFFLTVAEELNITHAAQKLYVSQQTLSNHIKRLEDELHTELFIRTPSLQLTRSGKAFMKYAKQIVYLQSQFQTEIDEIEGETRGEITVGCTRTRAHILLPKILPVFHQKYPMHELHIKIVNSKNIAMELNDGNIDVVICVHNASDSSKVMVHKLCEDNFCLVVPPAIMRQIFGNDAESVAKKYMIEGPDLTAFKDAPFLSLSGSSSRMQSLGERALGEAGIVPNVILEVTSADLLLRLCHCGMGVTLCYELPARDSAMVCPILFNTEPAYIFPIRNMQGEATYVTIAYSTERYLSRASKDFINVALSCFDQKMIDF